MNPPEWLAADHARPLGIRPVERLKQRVVFVSVAVRPAVHGDGLNIPRWVESAAGKHAAELVANVALEGVKGRTQKFPAPGPVLILAGQAGSARSAQQMQQAGLLWLNLEIDSRPSTQGNPDRHALK